MPWLFLLDKTSSQVCTADLWGFPHILGASSCLFREANVTHTCTARVRSSSLFFTLWVSNTLMCLEIIVTSEPPYQKQTTQTKQMKPKTNKQTNSIQKQTKKTTPPHKKKQTWHYFRSLNSIHFSFSLGSTSLWDVIKPDNFTNIRTFLW